MALWLPLLFSFQIASSLGIFHRWDLVSHRTQEISRGKGFQSLFDYGNSRKIKRQFDFEAPGGDATVLTECMTVSHSEPGRFTFTSQGEDEVCGLYLVGRPDEVVRLKLESARLSSNCREEVLVLVDGWELNGNVIPSSEDHPLPWEKRFKEECGGVGGGRQVLTSHQNAAMLQFKIPTPGHGFNLTVEYLHNPDPCNVLMSDLSGLFQITNRGEERNCSLTTLLFPAKISLLQLDVGAKMEKRGLMERIRREFTGIIPQCSDLGEKDFLEFGGAADLTASNLDTRSTMCGFEPEPAAKGLTILCGSSTVRLVSSGAYRNSVTFLVEVATDEDLDSSSNIVMTCPHFAK